MKKVMVVGGGGLIGGTTALLLQSRGYDVVIAGRTRPGLEAAVSSLAFVEMDYTCLAGVRDALAGFDGLVFAAGNDVRHKPPEAGDDYWDFANTECVPAFFQVAKEAGVRRAVNVGSFYPQAAPHLIDANAYIRSRWLADLGIRALADDRFAPMSVNAPLVVGRLDGVSIPFFDAHVRFATGELVPAVGHIPPGGVNFISTRSLAEAILGALEVGTGGAAYLVGDENLTFEAYFAAYFEAAGRQVPPVIDQDSPIFPDRSIYFGRGNALFYEPDPGETLLLGYRRCDVRPTIRDLVELHLASWDGAAH